jgi:hypothetical protein
MKLSRSPGRMSFQKEAYVKRCEKEGKLPSPEYLEMYKEDLKRYDARFDSADSKENSLEYTLLTTDWILEKVRSNKFYAQNLYAAMANNEFQKSEIWPILKGKTWSCTWRYAGGIVADMRQEGDYIDWYCSGIKGGDEPDVYNEGHDLKRQGYVGEGTVTDEVRNDLLKLGWHVMDAD